VPDNALTMIVLLTDGRSVLASDLSNGTSVEETISRKIRQLNKGAKIPIYTLGIGFDANTEFLENIAEVSCGRTCTGLVIEDIDAEPQLREVKDHLDDVVLKKLSLEYLSGRDTSAFLPKSLTKTQFKVFHQGSSVAVSGQFNSEDPYATFAVNITGQSSEGAFAYSPPPVPFITNGCYSEAKLCTRASFEGVCLTLNSSTPSLKDLDFDDKAWSVNIDGNCAWIAYEQSGYKGQSLTMMPGAYEVLPAFMHKKISSLRIVAMKITRTARMMTEGRTTAPANSVARLWAFVTIKEALERAADDSSTKEEIERAYSLAMKYQFLTPFTDMTFNGDPNANQTAVQISTLQKMLFQKTVLTYGELSPIFYADEAAEDISSATGLMGNLQGCEDPIQCQGNFHYELYAEEVSEESPSCPECLNSPPGAEPVQEGSINCNGSITLFTKPNFEGEYLEVENVSINQLYHDTNSQRMRSIRSRGNCCWLLFDHRFFAGGTVDRFCGEREQALRRTNIGSIQRMNQIQQQ